MAKRLPEPVLIGKRRIEFLFVRDGRYVVRRRAYGLDKVPLKAVSVRDAIDEMEELFRNCSKAADAPASLVTVRQLGEELVAAKKKAKRKRTGENAKFYITSWILPWFDDHCPYAANLNQAVWEDFTDHLVSQGKKVFTARIFFRQIMLRAFHQGLIKEKLTLKNPDAKTDAGRVVTELELRSLYAAVRAKRARLYRIKWRLILRLGERYGMRKNEIQTLEWWQINYEKSEVHIPKEKAKIRKSRTFRVGKGAMRAFRIWQQRGAWTVRPNQRRLNNESSWVFARWGVPDGPTENFNPSWQAIKAAAAVDCRFHDLRHSAITRAIGRGAAHGKVALYFGVSLKVIEDVYLHGSAEFTAEVAE